MALQCIQVRSNGLILFDAPSGAFHERYAVQQHTAAAYSGTVTAHTRKRLGCALDILVQRNPKQQIYNPISKTSHEFDLNFITLTIPNHKHITAAEGYDKLLGKWIRYMRDKYGLREYVWKCELQQNGQPHWHISSNCFIPWPVVRWKWNNLMRQERLLDKYALQHGTFNANSTDIHRTNDVVDMQKYLQKEMSKTTFLQVANGDPVHDVRWQKDEKIYRGYMFEDLNPECLTPVSWEASHDCIDYPIPGNKLVEASIDGKVWDCSEVLKMGRFSDQMDSETCNMIYAAKRQGKIELREMERCTVISTVYPLRLLSKAMVQEYRKKIFV